MSIMVKKLYKNGAFLYKMNLIAGKNGLGNLVQWVHIIEDDTATSFLHGNELVFTAGILNRGDWLLNFAQKLHETGTSAFVINIGPHIKEIPREVVEYCDQVNMPLFTIPWETRMVDMTRDFCHRIMNNEHVESDSATIIKNIIFNVGNIDTQVLQMEQFGYQRDSNFCFISIMTNENGSSSEDFKDSLAKIAEIVAKRMHELFITFSYKEFLILVLVNYDDGEIKQFVDEFLRLAMQQSKGYSLHLGVSSNQASFYKQKKNFEKALSAMKMAIGQNELYIYYDKLGIYKLLYAVGDKAVLRDYYKIIIGKLESYDKENKMQLALMLRTYLDNNGSLQLTAEKLFVHRNTVTNQLKKIEEITGYNPLDLEDKVKFCIAFYIKEIL